jgi:UDPglucose--hexose-1-phosphate uridylyltransferase
MKNFDINRDHRRFNPSINRWFWFRLIVQRPWQGQKTSGVQLPEYDPECYLCPGNVRANGEVNPTYDSCYVFEMIFCKTEPIVLKKTVHLLFKANRTRHF